MNPHKTQWFPSYLLVREDKKQYLKLPPNYSSIEWDKWTLEEILKHVGQGLQSEEVFVSLAQALATLIFYDGKAYTVNDDNKKWGPIKLEYEEVRWVDAFPPHFNNKTYGGIIRELVSEEVFTRVWDHLFHPQKTKRPSAVQTDLEWVETQIKKPNPLQDQIALRRFRLDLLREERTWEEAKREGRR